MEANSLILLVDDDPVMLQMLRSILESAGHSVLTAESPDEAAMISLGLTLNLIVTDLVMDPVDGFEFIERQRRNQESPPILVMSSLANSKSVTRAASLGINDYILKPFRLSIFMEKVEKILRR